MQFHTRNTSLNKPELNDNQDGPTVHRQVEEDAAVLANQVSAVVHHRSQEEEHRVRRDSPVLEPHRLVPAFSGARPVVAPARFLGTVKSARKGWRDVDGGGRTLMFCLPGGMLTRTALSLFYASRAALLKLYTRIIYPSRVACAPLYRKVM